MYAVCQGFRILLDGRIWDYESNEVDKRVQHVTVDGRACTNATQRLTCLKNFKLSEFRTYEIWPVGICGALRGLRSCGW
jgi:hypothetical protein